MPEDEIGRLVAAAVGAMRAQDNPGNMVGEYGLPLFPGGEPTTLIEIDGHIDVPAVVRAVVGALRKLPPAALDAGAGVPVGHAWGSKSEFITADSVQDVVDAAIAAALAE